MAAPASAQTLLAAAACVLDDPAVDGLSSSMSALLFVVLAVAILRRRVSHPRRRVTRLSRWWEESGPLLSEARFRRAVRVGRGTFERLVTLLAPVLDKQEENRHSAGRPRVPLAKRVALTLFRLGRKVSVLDVAERFGVGEATVVEATRAVSEAICTVFKDAISWPDDADRRRSAAQFFVKRRIPGVVGAIDGSHVRIRAPAFDQHPEAYVNRKGFHSLILQAVVDGFGRFIDVDIGWPGSVHDSRVLRNSRLYQQAEHGGLLDKSQFILADSGYPLKTWLVTPYRDDGHLSRTQRSFNFLHSSTRMRVERAFGILKGRFRSLLHGLDMTVENSARTILVCCILHNLCVQMDDELDEQDLVLDGPESDAFQVTEGARASSEAVRLRDELARSVVAFN